MEKEAIRNKMNKVFGGRYIISNEYQDKYYLYKEIHELFPEITESKIYGAIDEVNRILKSPIKGRKFVKSFVENLIL